MKKPKRVVEPPPELSFTHREALRRRQIAAVAHAPLEPPEDLLKDKRALPPKRGSYS